MSNVWMQSRAGRVADLLEPERNVIDFAEIAETLANINRYNGCASGRQVSVAFHTIIGASMMEPAMVPLFLIHDAHEAFIGDITTPAALALQAIGDEILARHSFLPTGGEVVKSALKSLKYRHDVAIHRAAGLNMPGPWEVAAIRHVDLRAMNTERRDFLVEEPAPWQSEEAGADPASWSDRWMSPDQTAEELHALFRLHLPALNGTLKAAA